MIGKKNCSLIAYLDEHKAVHFCFYSTCEENTAYHIMQLLNKLKKLPPSIHVVEKRITLMPCDLTKSVPIKIDFNCKKKPSSCHNHYFWD